VITFLSRGVPSVYRDRDRLRTWLTAVARDHGQSIGDLNYVLMSDWELLKYNRAFLRHDEFTDVITFDGNPGSGPWGTEVNGDVLMSLDRIRDNAGQYEASVQGELRRVMVHGLLHLLGHSDKTTALRKAMRAQEDKYLARY